MLQSLPAAKFVASVASQLEGWRLQFCGHFGVRSRGRAGALYVVTHPLMNANRARINTSVHSARLPTMAGFREFVEAGGLVSYGANFPDLFRRAAEIVDKILHGTKPGDIPVE